MPAGYGSQPGSRGHSAVNSRMGSRQASYAHAEPGAPSMGKKENKFLHQRLTKVKTEREAA